MRDMAWVRNTLGLILSNYLTLVWRTSRFVSEPIDLNKRLTPDLPVIIALWHGQFFMGPFMRRKEYRAKALISLHRDADIIAIAAERLGMGTIRGSGDHEGRYHRKGGVRAFVALRQALRDRCSVVLTADVPKVSRVAGRGIVMLARGSGRPIYPLGIATSRRIELRNWDRTTMNLPFSRGAFVLGEPIWVPENADEEMIEAFRKRTENALNLVNRRASELACAQGSFRSSPYVGIPVRLRSYWDRLIGAR